jgi:membrane associated rhomboid family serine protease
MKRQGSLDTEGLLAAVFLCSGVAGLAIGVPWAFGWAGDSRVVGAVAIVGGLASLSEVRRLLRMRRYTTRTPLDENVLIAPAKRRPLTYALVYFLAGLTFGLLIADVGVGLILGLAGFAVGWLSSLPIERRRRPKR